MVAESKKGKQMGLKVYTGGTFDLIHSGHVNFLQRCAQIGEVTVSLNTDAFIAEYKGKPPIMTYQERKLVLEGLRWVDSVIPNEDGVDSTTAICKVQPDIIAIGTDWARRDYYTQMGFTQDWLDEQNISLMYIPYTQGISTTELKRRIGTR